MRDKEAAIMGHSHGQRGVTLMGLIILLFVVIFVALLGFKLIPAYIDFYTAKKAINAVARQGTTAAEIRRSFELRSAIDDIKVRSSDLEITKEGNELVVGFAYRKEVPLFANVGIYIDFAASSKDQ
jgi:Tfp pilus assembly protein PilE